MSSSKLNVFSGVSMSHRLSQLPLHERVHFEVHANDIQPEPATDTPRKSIASTPLPDNNNQPVVKARFAATRPITVNDNGQAAQRQIRSDFAVRDDSKTVKPAITNSRRLLAPQPTPSTIYDDQSNLLDAHSIYRQKQLEKDGDASMFKQLKPEKRVNTIVEDNYSFPKNAYFVQYDEKPVSRSKGIIVPRPDGVVESTRNAQGNFEVTEDRKEHSAFRRSEKLEAQRSLGRSVKDKTDVPVYDDVDMRSHSARDIRMTYMPVDDRIAHPTAHLNDVNVPDEDSATAVSREKLSMQPRSRANNIAVYEVADGNGPSPKMAREHNPRLRTRNPGASPQVDVQGDAKVQSSAALKEVGISRERERVRTNHQYDVEDDTQSDTQTRGDLSYQRVRPTFEQATIITVDEVADDVPFRERVAMKALPKLQMVENERAHVDTAVVGGPQPKDKPVAQERKREVQASVRDLSLGTTTLASNLSVFSRDQGTFTPRKRYDVAADMNGEQHGSGVHDAVAERVSNVSGNRPQAVAPDTQKILDSEPSANAVQHRKFNPASRRMKP